jgi:hypothetical protein
MIIVKQFKIAQKVLNQEMEAKERQFDFSQANQSVLDLTSPGKQSVTGEMKNFESKTLLLSCANFNVQKTSLQRLQCSVLTSMFTWGDE